MNRFRAILLTLFACSVFWGCNGEDCTEKPTVQEHHERSLEMVEEVLDEAEAFERQRKRALEINKSLDPDRKVMLEGHEKIRSKLIDELAAPKPNRKRFHDLIDSLAKVWMAYTFKTLNVTMDTHKMFTDEQREALAASVDAPPGKFKPFMLNRALDVALFKIDATKPQRKMVWSLREKLVNEANSLYKKQPTIRKKMLALWRERDLDRDATLKLTARAGAQITTFVHALADGIFDVLETLKPDQRVFTDKQIRRMERCVES